MRKALIVTILNLLCISLQAQLISFRALKNGVIDDTEIRMELILNGFTKFTSSSNSDTDTYAYNYDETKETASIRVGITPLVVLENTGLYSIYVQTSGDYIHDELVQEIIENCTLEGIKGGDGSVYTCDYTTFLVSSQGGNRLIMANPNFEQLTEDMTEEEFEEFMKVISKGDDFL